MKQLLKIIVIINNKHKLKMIFKKQILKKLSKIIVIIYNKQKLKTTLIMRLKLIFKI